VSSATRNLASGRIEIFEYPASPDAPPLPAWHGFAKDGETASQASDASAADARGGAIEARLHSEFERQMAEETRRSFEAGRERGRQEGRHAEREAQAASQAAAERQCRQQAADWLASFAEERDRYLREVEHEVVSLSLAVAARILRREAQMDPLLLTGAVRVALGQLSSSTQVRLRVPAAELDLWTEAIALLPNLTIKPAVIGGVEMRLGDCVIETELGSVDLGLRAQLGEIERGFFDRAGSPGAESRSSRNADIAGDRFGAGHESRA
jgi:flagellar assembly protein FliH